MKMLVVVFRDSLTSQVHALLNEHEVRAFSELHNVAGKGESGATSQFFLDPSTNRMILTAVSDTAAYRLIDGFTRFRSQQEAATSDHALPLHVFVLPCEQAV